MKKILFGIGLLLMACCQNNTDLKHLYSYHYQQSSSFDENNVDQIMDNDNNVLDESQLNDSIQWNKMKLIDSIVLKKHARKINVYQCDLGKRDYICYTTNNKLKLIAYSTLEMDTDLIYILKDKKFKEVIKELIGNEKFILNQINETPPW